MDTPKYENAHKTSADMLRKYQDMILENQEEQIDEEEQVEEEQVEEAKDEEVDESKEEVEEAKDEEIDESKEEVEEYRTLLTVPDNQGSIYQQILLNLRPNDSNQPIHNHIVQDQEF